MELKDLGYNTSDRDVVFEKIWEKIGDSYMILASPLKSTIGNVIVLPDEIYWDCDALVKISDPCKKIFKQKWTYYRPSIFATKHNLVKSGCLIYNRTWYVKMSTGEVQDLNKIKYKLQNNTASVEEISRINWDGVDITQRGIWGIKNLGGRLLGLYLDLDNDFSDIWKKEKKEESLFCYEKMNNNGLKYVSILSIADMAEKDNNITKNDMIKVYNGLCIVLHPDDTLRKRRKGKVTFDFGDITIIDEDIMINNNVTE